MPQSEEDNFPRGGVKHRPEKSSTTRKKKVHTERNLFQEVNDEKKKRAQKRKGIAPEVKKVKKAKVQGSQESKSTEHDRLTVQTLSTGMVILGCVKEVHEYEIIMGLPDNLSGTVPITNISDGYRAQLEELAGTAGGDQEGGDSEEVHDLNDLFTPGMLLPCKVMSVQRKMGNKSEVKLSINPKDVHQQLSSTAIRNGMAIYGNVGSQEDHGYIIDFGIKNIRAFLKNKDAERYIQLHNDGFPLPVGKPVLCAVETDADRMERVVGETRAINVTIDPKKVAEAQTKETSNLNWLVAGMKVPVTVVKSTDKGIAVKMSSCKSFIPRSHLSNFPESYKHDQEILSSILYVHPTSKMVILSCLYHIVHYAGVAIPDRFGDLEVGTVVEEAKILRIDKAGLYLGLGEKKKGFVSLKNVSDEPVQNLAKEFKKGSIHRCRVLGFDLIDDVAIVTMKQSVLKQQFLSIKGIEPGAVVQCTVASVGDKGVTVKVTSKIQGFIPTMHLADVPLKHPEKKFETGKTLKCRVLTVDRSKQRVKLTNKKSLVKSKYPILTSYSELSPGLEVEGFIGDVKDQGCLVVFYNDMKGWVPARELSTEHIPYPQKVFYRGQVVRCRVLSWSEEDQRMTLTFKLESKVHFGTKEAAVPDDFEIGKLSGGKVKSKSEKGLELELLPSKKPAFLPTMHLSESLALQHLLYDTYKNGEVIEDAMFLNKTNVVMLTIRPSMINASRDGHIVHQISSLQPGMVIPGTVKNLMHYGIFIELPAGLVGLVPNKLATARRLDDMSTVYKPGQPVLVKVTEIDKVKGRFLGSLKMADCYQGDTDIGLNLLEDYFKDVDRIREYLSTKKGGEHSSFLQISVGDVCSVIVEEVSEVGVICRHVNSKVRGFATEEHVKGVEVQAGEQVEAVIIATDLSTLSLEFSLDKELVHNIKKRKNNAATQAREGQHMKADVVLVKPSYILVALRGHALGQLAYLPSKRHLNDVLEVHQFAVGQTHSVIIKRVDKCVLCSLAVHEERKEKEARKAQKASSTAEDKGEVKQTLKLGSIVKAQIRKIHPRQLDLVMGSTHGRVHVTEATDIVKDGQDPFSKFKESQNISVRIIGFRHVKTSKFLTISRHNRGKTIPECTLKKSKWSLPKEKLLENTKQKYNIGDKVTAFVQNFSKRCMWFDISLTTRGRAYVMNLSKSPEVLADPELHFKQGTGYNATVIGFGEDGVLELSLTGQADQVKEGTCAIGWISKVVDATGLIVKLADGYKGVIRLTDLADEYKENPLADFERGQYVQCYVKSAKDKRNCVFSLRQSRIQGSSDGVMDPEVTMETLNVGQVLRGYVVSCENRSLLVSLGCDLCGPVSKDHMTDYVIQDPKSVFRAGHLVTVKVLKKDSETDFINLTMRESETGVPENIPQELKSEKASSSTKTTKKTKKRKGESDRGAKSKPKRKKSVSESDSISDGERRTKTSKVITDSDTDSGLGGVKDQEEADTDTEVQVHVPRSSLPRLGVSAGFSWNTDFIPPSHVDQDSDEESDSDIEVVPQKKTRQQLKQEKAEEEKKLYEYERQQLEGEVIPQSPEEFDRLVLQSPDSSMVWLRYMAFHLETAEIEKARAVAERALKTISFREEQEKLNVWVGYLNLENMYGTPELLKKVLERALQQNEQLEVYQQLVNIYVKSGKMEEAEQLYNMMTRKFGQHKEVWTGFGQFYFKNERPESARKLLQRCLKSLDNRFHVETIAKFAQMEFKEGEPERGKTMFENILSNYPKRTDLWSVYIDMVTKLGQLEVTRQIFERVINLKLSAKKMKFFFKKYLDFEKTHGDDKSMEDVKSKALAYVESKGYVDD